MGTTVGKLEVDPNGKPHIIGESQVAYFKRIYRNILLTGNPVMLVGAPGTGKTHFGMQLIEALARKLQCNAWHIQLNEESTQESIFGSYQIRAEGEVQVLVAAGLAARDGDVIFIDELPHALPNAQSSLNRAFDRSAYISVADQLIKKHPNCRFVLGGNGLESGVYGLKQSLASRIYAYKRDFPDAETEADIALDIAMRTFAETMPGQKPLKHVPHGVVRYLTSVARQIREDTECALPVSSRNVAMMIEAMALEEYDSHVEVRDDWEFGDTGEALRAKVAERVFFVDKVAKTSDLHHEMVEQTLQFIGGIGFQIFKEDVQSGCMYHLGIENIPQELMKRYQENINTTII